MTSPGWTLQSGTRRFGPMTEDEMRAYFRAGMVKANDVLHAPDREAPLSAADAAEELGMPAPPPLPVAPVPYEPRRAPPEANAGEVAPTAPPVVVAPPSNLPLVPPPPTSGFKVTERGPDARWPVVLWIAVLFGLHLVLVPSMFPARAASMNGFALVSFVVCALVAAAVFFGFKRLAESMRTRPPRVYVALAALTLAYVGFGANHILFNSTIDPGGQRVDLRAGNLEWYRQAEALWKQKDHAALLALSNRWLKSSEDNFFALMWRGMALRKLQRYTEAARDFERMVVLRPDDAWSWVALGNARYDNGDYPRAIEAYRRSIELDPTNKNVWLDMGNAYSRVQQPNDQVSAYERAIALDPRFAVAWGNLSRAYARQGRTQEADEARAKAEALGWVP